MLQTIATTDNPFVQTDMLRFYEEVFVPAFFWRWAEHLVEKIPRGNYKKIVDIATGPGTVIQPLLRKFPKAEILGTDPSEGFLAIARKKHTSTSFLQASSDALPFESESIDLLTCQQGIQYFPDKAASVKEMCRALKKGGRMALAVWDGIEYSPQFSLYKQAMKAAGANAEALAMVELPFSWNNRETFEKLATSCGLKVTYSGTLQSPSTYASFPAVVAGAFGAPFGPHLMQMNNREKQCFEQTLRESVEPHRKGEQYEFPMSSHILIGEK